MKKKINKKKKQAVIRQAFGMQSSSDGVVSDFMRVSNNFCELETRGINIDPAVSSSSHRKKFSRAMLESQYEAKHSDEFMQAGMLQKLAMTIS